MFQNKSIRFENCQLIKENGVFKKDFCILNSKIVNQLENPDIKINCRNLLISPGYIDLQINGAWGIDFSSPEIEIKKALKIVSHKLLETGVTSFCPTIITSSKNTYKNTLPKIKRRKGNKDLGANILGIHLEGPFINSKKKGAHSLELIKDENKIESINQLKDFYGTLENVSIITLAPELICPNVFRDLKKKGIVVSMGHTDATLEEAELAMKNGCRLITHLFNAMPSFHHRNPGIIGSLTSKDKAIFLCDDDKENYLKKQLYFSVICDGVHTHDSAIRFAYHANPDGFICITDGVAPMGLESNKKHNIGDKLIEIQKEKAFIAGTNTLCGSIVPLNSCIKKFKKATNCHIYEAIATATSKPAKAINIYPQKGSLEAQADADFLILNENLDVLATFISGELAWCHDSISYLFY